MTKTIVIGEGKEIKRLTQVKFERVLNNVVSIGMSNAVIEAPSSPGDYKYIELICKNYQPGHDLMFAYNDPSNREAGLLYIGKWNDGIVE